MKHSTLGLFRPKLVQAASLVLILLLGGCLSVYGQPDNAVSGSEGAPEEQRSSLTGLFDTLFETVKSWTAPDTKDVQPSSELTPSNKAESKELPDQTASDDMVDPPAKKEQQLSIIELEAKKAQALQDQRMGIECVDCVDDGEGNLLPADLVQSIQLQKKKTHANGSPGTKKSDDSNEEENKLGSKEDRDDYSSHDHIYDEKDESQSFDDSTDEKPKLNFDAVVQQRQLGKSKNRIIAPRLPFPPATNCRCEYPSENIYTSGIQQINQFFGGLLILPRNSVYCQNVAFICDIRDRPANSVEFTCPNLQPPVLIRNKGKGKGNKNNVIFNNGFITPGGFVDPGFVIPGQTIFVGGKVSCWPTECNSMFETTN